MLAATERAAKGALRVKPAERIVLVTDRQKVPIAEAFAHWFHHVRAETTTYLMTETLRPIRGLTALLRSMVEQADLVLYMLEDRPEEKEFRRELVEVALRHGRICMMPGITADILERLGNLNYSEMQELAQKIVERMSGAREVRVTDAQGTDVAFSVFGRRWLNDSGDIGQRGAHGALPAGRCFTAPVEETFKGVLHLSLVNDKAANGFLRFDKGRVVEFKGQRIAQLIKKIGRDAGGKIIGEVGIGINRNARMCDNVIETEKAFGVVHFAIGDSHGLGPNQSKHHHDLVVGKATVVADEQPILKEGEFQF